MHDLHPIARKVVKGVAKRLPVGDRGKQGPLARAVGEARVGKEPQVSSIQLPEPEDVGEVSTVRIDFDDLR